MSTRAERKARAQTRRTADPVADRAAAAAAIYAQYDEAAAEATEEALKRVRGIWADCDQRLVEAWAERCRKLGELEGREIPSGEAAELEAEEAITAAKERGADRLIADLAADAEAPRELEPWEVGYGIPEEDR